MIGHDSTYTCFKHPKCSGTRSKHAGRVKRPSSSGDSTRKYMPSDDAPACPICGGPGTIVRMWSRRYYDCAAYPSYKGKLVRIEEERMVD